MEQENNIVRDMSLLNIEYQVNSDPDVQVNSHSENPSLPIDEVKTENDPVVNVSDGQDLSFDEACRHVSSEKDPKSDHRMDHSLDEKNISGADARGHDLPVVQRFPKHDLQMSNSAVADMNGSQSKSAQHSSRKSDVESKFKLHTFIAMFPQPGAYPQFIRTVHRQKVCLESVLIQGATLKGIIGVWNLGFQKLIQVYYTTDNWKTRTGVDANYLDSNLNKTIDRFTFAIYPPVMRIGESLLFYIKYTVNGCYYWDNNCTQDYRLDRVALL